MLQMEKLTVEIKVLMVGLVIVIGTTCPEVQLDLMVLTLLVWCIVSFKLVPPLSNRLTAEVCPATRAKPKRTELTAFMLVLSDAKARECLVYS